MSWFAARPCTAAEPREAHIPLEERAITNLEWTEPVHRILVAEQLSVRREGLQRLVRTAPVTGRDVIWLPPALNSKDAYLDAARGAFGLDRDLTWDQAWDVQLDWVRDRRRALIVWPELHWEHHSTSGWLTEVLGRFVTELYWYEEEAEYTPRPWFRLLATARPGIEDIVGGIEIYIGRAESDPRSDAEIAERYLQVRRMDQEPGSGP